MLFMMKTINTNCDFWLSTINYDYMADISFHTLMYSKHHNPGPDTDPPPKSSGWKGAMIDTISDNL